MFHRTQRTAKSPTGLLDISHQLHVRLLGLSTLSCFLANKQTQCWGWSPGLFLKHLSAKTSDVLCVKSTALFSAMRFLCDLGKVAHFEFQKRLQELEVQPGAEGTEAELQQQMRSQMQKGSLTLPNLCVALCAQRRISQGEGNNTF